MSFKKVIQKWIPGPVFTISCILLIASCNNLQDQNNTSLKNMEPKDIPLNDATIQALQTVSNSRVLFAHHSVGRNILEGLEEIIQEAELDAENLIKVVENSVTDNRPVLAHTKPGKNGQPDTKVDGFTETIRKLDNFKPQMAAMKFCFVDFNPHTDVDQVFDYYRNNIEALKKERPDVVFAHVTAPLKKRSEKLKQRINRLLGRMVWSDESNLKRAEFNKRLYETYRNEPIFDLARVESTKPDGSREKHNYKGQEFYSLVPEYTYDGGHLNDLGKRVVAIEMARFLDETIRNTHLTQ